MSVKQVLYSIVLLLILLTVGTRVRGQGKFLYESDRFSVIHQDYYKLELSPDIISKLNKGFSNLALYNQDQQEIAYQLIAEKHLQTATDVFIECSILESNRRKDCCSEYIVENSLACEIDNVVLRIKQKQTEKKVRLSGSYDRSQWFTIRDDFLFSLADSDSSQTAEIRLSNFPVTTYKYYKISIDDFTSTPLELVQIGFYQSSFKKEIYQRLPVRLLRQTNDTLQQVSYLDFQLDTAHYVDRLHFYFIAPMPYRRVAELYVCPGNDEPCSFVLSMELSSKHPNQLLLHRLHSKTFRIKVYNQKEAPLTFKEIAAYQLKSYLLAPLKAGQSYFLSLGGEGQQQNSETTYPLNNHDSLHVIYIDRLKAVGELPVEAVSKESQNQGYFWLIVSAISAVLVTAIVVLIKKLL